MKTPLKFYEFFAGGGMARAGLGSSAWKCLFANDFDEKKTRIYAKNWGPEVIRHADVKTLTASDLPGVPDLVWASFPCQDLSLAGGGAGLRGERSGTFWPFWRLMLALKEAGRGPKAIVLENVCGMLSSHQGKDFTAICETLSSAGYRFGALVVDAVHFLPQSRPRLFIIALRRDLAVPKPLTRIQEKLPWFPKHLIAAYDRLPVECKNNWLWWNLPAPAPSQTTLRDIIESQPAGINWHSATETQQIVDKMSPANREKLTSALALGHRMVGALYRRTRIDADGVKVQRAEVRFDDLAGCLRTPAGGSSRQIIVIVENGRVSSRLISSRETARLMGLPDTYVLPSNYNEAYHLTGDGVAVPVVRHLAQHILEPMLCSSERPVKSVA